MHNLHNGALRLGRRCHPCMPGLLRCALQQKQTWKEAIWRQQLADNFSSRMLFDHKKYQQIVINGLK